MATSDVITLHCPLLPTTRNLIADREFGMMKRKPLLIDTSRGGLVDEDALGRALHSGQITGAAFDVVTSEPPAPDHPFMQLANLPNFIVTPHIAWASQEGCTKPGRSTHGKHRAFRSGETASSDERGRVSKLQESTLAIRVRNSLRAVFMRGGTSKALIFHIADLPRDREDWAPIFLSAMGTPDPYGRQLDGMGGGISSLSKVCVVGPPSRRDADVDFTFAQVGIDRPIVDYAGNCGNMSSAIGPFAVDEGLVSPPADGMATVRIHNTNTAKLIHAHFPVAGGRVVFDGDFEIDGVAGRSAPIRLDFLDPEGAKTGKALPTGSPVDRFDIEGRGPIEASLVDAANPSVFVRASDLGLSGTELPERLERSSALCETLERIRVLASVRMGMAPDVDAASKQASQPKIALLAPPADMTTLSGHVISRRDHDILCRMISMGRPHRAIPITGALCLAAACRIPGTIAMEALKQQGGSTDVRIAHPSGITVVAAKAAVAGSRTMIEQATIYRTARRLFEGRVYY